MTKATRENPKPPSAPPDGSLIYVECACQLCGWVDDFRADAIENGLVHGYCDRCDRERWFVQFDKRSAARTRRMKNTENSSCSLPRVVGLRRCSCGKRPRVSFEDYVWIECPDGDDGCQDSIWATTPERAKELWNEAKHSLDTGMEADAARSVKCSTYACGERAACEVWLLNRWLPVCGHHAKNLPSRPLSTSVWLKTQT